MSAGVIRTGIGGWTFEPWRGVFYPDTVKQKDGVAPFPKREESEYDTFGVGHSSTSISAALGMAIALAQQGDDRKVVAVIGDSENEASIGLHRSLGFEDAGVVRDVGFKHGRWVDIVTMQRMLNGGAATPPEGPGIRLG